MVYYVIKGTNVPKGTQVPLRPLLKGKPRFPLDPSLKGNPGSP